MAFRTEKRERQREAKAEVAAQLEKSIEKELLERLQKGVYPTDIVNINMKEYEKVKYRKLLQTYLHTTCGALHMRYTWLVTDVLKIARNILQHDSANCHLAGDWFLFELTHATF